MEKKFQIFVSSTFTDLVDERKEIMQSLLELNCIPVTMELFPAADDDQWTLIKRLIDDCDYYIVVVAGRYGSLSNTGKGYTQMEYEYALSKGIPIIGFLHGAPETIPLGKSETDPTLVNKLEEFRTLVKLKTCKFWRTPADLGSKVKSSLIALIKDKPRLGWVKSDLLPEIDDSGEILSFSNSAQLTKRKHLRHRLVKLSWSDINLQCKKDLIVIGWSCTNANTPASRDFYKGLAESNRKVKFITFHPEKIRGATLEMGPVCNTTHRNVAKDVQDGIDAINDLKKFCGAHAHNIELRGTDWFIAWSGIAIDCNENSGILQIELYHYANPYGATQHLDERPNLILHPASKFYVGFQKSIESLWDAAEPL